MSYTNRKHTKIAYLIADAFDNIKLLKEDIEIFGYRFSQKECKTIGGKVWCALTFAPITKIRDNFKDNTLFSNHQIFLKLFLLIYKIN